ncbi:MAG: GNAT family N-acetyltransferase [Muribaculaceae bacterium]|nr:GNAT family N-acetyltransferase [Muribaculaceae bacterium]
MELNIKRFEELTTRELYEILRCRSVVFVLGQECVYQDVDELDFCSTHVYFSEGGRIMAYLRVIDPGVKFESASIGRVLTMDEFRGRGLARALMIEGIKIGKSRAKAIEIEAQAYLRDFYKSLGFREISEVFMLENIPHVSMVLE